MTEHREQITGLARQVHRTAIERNIPTRQAAAQVLVAVGDTALLKAMAAEFLVDLIARSQGRQASVTPLPVPAPFPTQEDHRVPRKGTKERAQWERETLAGQAWAAAEAEADRRANAAMVESVSRAMDEFAASLRVQWTEELLNSTFRDADRNLVRWGDATIAQHEEHRDELFRTAGNHLRDAALHEAAIAELVAADAETIRSLVETNVA